MGIIFFMGIDSTNLSYMCAEPQNYTAQTKDIQTSSIKKSTASTDLVRTPEKDFFQKTDNETKSALTNKQKGLIAGAITFIGGVTIFVVTKGKKNKIAQELAVKAAKEAEEKAAKIAREAKELAAKKAEEINNLHEEALALNKDFDAKKAEALAIKKTEEMNNIHEEALALNKDFDTKKAEALAENGTKKIKNDTEEKIEQQITDTTDEITTKEGEQIQTPESKKLVTTSKITPEIIENVKLKNSKIDVYFSSDYKYYIKTGDDYTEVSIKELGVLIFDSLKKSNTYSTHSLCSEIAQIPSSPADIITPLNLQSKKFQDLVKQGIQAHDLDQANNHLKTAHYSKLDISLREKIAAIDKNMQRITPNLTDEVYYRAEVMGGGFGAAGKEDELTSAALAHYKEISSKNIGDVITAPTYMYTAKSPVTPSWIIKKSGKYDKSILYEIKTPKGSKILDCGNEDIFPRDAQFKVLSKTIDEKGVLNIKVEYMLPKS